MIRAVNGLAAYALGLELRNLLSGGRLVRAWRFPCGMTLEFGAARIGYLHLLLPGHAAELVPSSELLVPAEAGEAVMAAAVGARLETVRPLGLDRVLLVTFEADRAWKEPAPLVLRIDLSGAFRAAALFGTGSTRPLETFGEAGSRIPEGPQTLPAAKPWSLLDLPRRPPTELAATSGSQTALALAASIGGLDPLLAAALETRTRGDIEALFSALGGIGAQLSAEEFEWRVFDLPGRGGETVCAVYPVALPLPARTDDPQGMLEALDLRAAEIVLPAWRGRLLAALATRRRRELRRARRLLSNVEQDLRETERAAELRHMGNLLVTWRHMMRPGQHEITVRDFSGERKVTIPLDPALAPDANIRRYFRRAKKGELGRTLIRVRHGRIRAEVRRLEQELTALERTTDTATLAALATREAPPPRRSTPDAAAPRLRRYDLGAGHVILVGRSERENDELTHRVAAPSDLWFHAQGYAGSHVILKGTGPSTPARIIRAAAEAAAWFSKGKHSGTVSVIYTEKRYVRKPRGSRPGAASCLRSKTLLVTPRLPRGEESGQK